MDFYDIDKIKLEGVDENAEYIPEQECEKNETAVSELKKNSLKQNYDFINVVVMAVVFLATAVVFLAVTGNSAIDEDELTLTGKNFLSGEYAQKLENKYLKQLPFPDEIKAVEDRIALVYGIGNKIEHKWSSEEDVIDQNHNSFDTNTQQDLDSSNTDDNGVIITVTTTGKNEDSKAPAETKKTEQTKKTTTTAALQRPAETYPTTTTTTTVTTTNNTAPTVTTTTQPTGN